MNNDDFTNESLTEKTVSICYVSLKEKQFLELDIILPILNKII